MAFPQEFLDELIFKNDIVDVVGSYVSLKERGGRYWGLCPFHTEKTPSFSVNRDRQMYYCFGCKEGGGVINFIMKMERMTYPEAVEFLARRVSLAMPENVNDRSFEDFKKLRERIYEINKAAARFFHASLHAGAGKDALEYLRKRGVDKKNEARFGLGFAPEGWNELSAHLLSLGFDEQDILKSGLAKKNERGLYDVFRNRVMFPIINAFSEVIAFGGRVMDDSQPKYLNSPDTAVFNKRKNLYAINLLKSERSLKRAVLVEGYMDVISLYSAGVTGVLASLGTALTPEQAYLIKRYVPNVYVSYDGDYAGITAAVKACGVLEPAGINVRVLCYGEGEDPDDFVRRHGAEGIRRKMKDSRTPMDFELDQLLKGHDISTIDGKTDYSTKALALIAKLNNDLLTERYIRRVSAETGFSAQTLANQLKRLQSGGNTYNDNWNNRTKEKEGTRADIKAEQAFAAAVLAKPSELEPAMVEISLDCFKDELAKKIIKTVLERIKEGLMPVCAEILSGLDEDEAKRAAQWVAQDVSPESARGLARQIAVYALVRERDKLAARLKNAGEEEKKELQRSIMAIARQIQEKKH